MAANGNNNWKSEKLADICAQITDGKHGDCQDEPDSGFYFLSCKDVANGRLNYDGARQITEADFLDTHRRTKFAPSDVLITNSGTIGRMAIAPDNELTRRTTFQKSVAILKPVTSHVEPNFLYYALQSDIRRLIEFAGGTAQMNLLLRDLRAFEVKVPPLPVQRRIAGILSAYDELMENSQRRIRLLEAMARALSDETDGDIYRDESLTPSAIIDPILEIKRYFAEHPEELYDLHPRRFEELIADILKDFGFETELTKATRDGGRDIYAYVKNAVTSFLMFVECKKWAQHNKVGIDVVQRMHGAAKAGGAHKAMIVTTSFFTLPAQNERRRIEKELDLADYDTLKTWLARYK